MIFDLGQMTKSLCSIAIKNWNLQNCIFQLFNLVHFFCIPFTVVSKPNDCIFPYDFKEAVRKKVS